MEMRPRLLLIVVVVVVIALCAAAIMAGAENATASQLPPASYNGEAASFNVKNYEAKANDATNDTKALMATWKAACAATGAVTLVVPAGSYYIGLTQFHEPCKGSTIGPT